MKKTMKSKATNALFIGILSAVATLLLSSTAGAALIVNGDFELTAIADGTFQEIGAGSDPLTGWTISEFGVMKDHNRFGASSDGSTFLALESNTYGPGAGIISQSFATDVGYHYSLSFEYSALATTADTTITYALAGATLGPEAVPVFTFSNASGQVWRTETISFTANSTTTTLSFKGNGGLASIASSAIDNVSVDFVAIPEPGTFALIGGLLALCSVMVRRRR